jgi:transcriptional regulator with XRE-family HTH domain
MANRKELRKAIKDAGLKPQEVADHLGLPYNTYAYRLRVDGLSLDDYWKLTALLAKSFEELFPNPYEPAPKLVSTSIALTRDPKPAAPALPPVDIEKREYRPKEVLAKLIEAPTPPSPDVPKKEEKPVGSSSGTGFKAIDIGIPMIDAPRILEDRDFHPLVRPTVLPDSDILPPH